MLRLAMFVTVMLALPWASANRIPANTWTELTPQDCAGDLCSGPHPEWRGYSGSSIGNGYIWWWGGGHKAGPTNDIDAYNISENRWEQFTTAEDIRNTPHWDHLTAEQKKAQLNTWGGGRGPMYWSPLGRFMTHHSYQWQLWNPKRHKWCGLFPYPPKQKPVYVCYDPAKGDASGQAAASGTDPTQPDGAFEIISESVPDWNTGRHTAGLTWDSKRQQVAMTSQARGATGIWRYDADRDDWYRVADRLPKGPRYNEGYIEYHPGEDAYYTSRRQQLSRVDAKTGIAQKIANPPVHLLSFSLEYSPELDRMLLGSTQNGIAHIYAYDLPDNEWQKLLLHGEPPTDSTLGYDLLDRDPQTGQYFLIRDANSYNRTDGVYTFTLTPDILGRKPSPCPVEHCVGNAYRYASVQAAIDNAAAGDVVGLADGDYEQCVVINRPVTLRALSGRPHLRDRVCDTKGVIVVNTQGSVTIQDIEISGAADEKAIWQSRGRLALRNVLIHDSGMGVLAAKPAESLEIHDSEFHSIDDPNELAHFVYAAEVQRLTMTGNRLHGGTDGHFIKAQSVDVDLRSNVIHQTRLTNATLIDVWGCGDNTIVGNDLRSANTSAPVNAIGVTQRTRADRPCPVNRFHFRAESNTYIKEGERKWSSFVNNRFEHHLPTSDLLIRHNNVKNAWLVSDKTAKYDEATWRTLSTPPTNHTDDK